MGVTLREAPHGRMDGSSRACMEILSGNLKAARTLLACASNERRTRHAFTLLNHLFPVPALFTASA